MAIQNVINKRTADLTIDPGAAGDSYIQFDINTANKFRIGSDDDASDAFKISYGNALGTTDRLIMETTGECTMPSQSAFLAHTSGTLSNVTGDATWYAVVFGTEIFDQNGDFDGTSTFTAPVTGKYLFMAEITFEDLAAAHITSATRILTSNRSYWDAECGSGGRDSSNRYSIKINAIADMDAADTAYIYLYWGGGAKVVDIAGGAGYPESWFCGALLC